MIKKFKFFVIALVGIVSLSLYQNCSKSTFRKGQGCTDASGNPTSCSNPLQCNYGSPHPGDAPFQAYPTPCQSRPSFLTSSSVGFELGESHYTGFALTSNNPAGTTAEKNLYIEIATYSHPDSFIITYDNATEGNDRPLFDVCNLSTWTQALLGTFRTNRPYSSTIVQFGLVESQYPLKIPVGTTRIRFDFGKIVSGNYIGIWNLNDFSNSLNVVKSNYVNKVYTDANGPGPFPQPGSPAPMPGAQNDNQSGDPANSFVCPAIDTDGIGGYGCYSPGNFRYQAAPLGHYNDTAGNGDPTQPVCPPDSVTSTDDIKQ